MCGAGQAARGLFKKNGFLDADVGDIARKARVAHGTFYTYFNSKEEIFTEVVESLLADFQRIAAEEPTVSDHSSISERIERANRGYIRAYEANARMMAVLEQVATFNSRLAQMRRRDSQLLAAAQQRGHQALAGARDHRQIDRPRLRRQCPRLDGRPLGIRVDRARRAV